MTERTERKPVSMVIGPENKQLQKILIVMCDDGSMWSFVSKDGKWTEEEPIKA